MKIVLDTNVFISGIFFGGPPSQILKSWKKSEIRIVLTEEILEEYQRVGEELSAKYPSIDIEPIIELFTIYGEFVETKGVSVSVCEDPDDNKFIECAIASQSKLIVSGDKHLLKISGYKDIEVLKPRNFGNFSISPGKSYFATIQWIPAFAGMTGAYTQSSFPRRRESSDCYPDLLRSYQLRGQLFEINRKANQSLHQTANPLRPLGLRPVGW